MTFSLVKPQVIIIGTEHRLQAGHDDYTPSQLKVFANLIETARKKYRAKFIAEEMSGDVLADLGVTATVAETLSKRKGLGHQYVDLSLRERVAFKVDRLGLHQVGQTAGLSAAQFAALEKIVGELRECVWLVRVMAINIWPVLFICGANHAPRVQYLFNTVGKLAVIEVNDFQVKPSNPPDSPRKALRGR